MYKIILDIYTISDELIVDSVDIIFDDYPAWGDLIEWSNIADELALKNNIDRSLIAWGYSVYDYQEENNE